jgi:hypothetical protein
MEMYVVLCMKTPDGIFDEHFLLLQYSLAADCSFLMFVKAYNRATDKGNI